MLYDKNNNLIEVGDEVILRCRVVADNSGLAVVESIGSGQPITLSTTPTFFERAEAPAALAPAPAPAPEPVIENEPAPEPEPEPAPEPTPEHLDDIAAAEIPPAG